MDIDKRTPKRRLGDEGEEQACKMLASKGFRIEQRNYSCKMGEIDIIAVHPKERVLAFVEVKTRGRTDMGLPCEAVGWKKQQKQAFTCKIQVCRILEWVGSPQGNLF